MWCADREGTEKSRWVAVIAKATQKNSHNSRLYQYSREHNQSVDMLVESQKNLNAFFPDMRVSWLSSQHIWFSCGSSGIKFRLFVLWFIVLMMSDMIVASIDVIPDNQGGIITEM